MKEDSELRLQIQLAKIEFEALMNQWRVCVAAY